MPRGPQRPPPRRGSETAAAAVTEPCRCGPASLCRHPRMHPDRGRHVGKMRHISTLWELTCVSLHLRKAATPSVLLPSRLEGLESKAVGRG
uniref:Uncharacterized protein n=1 Tax=Rangifer tarandus platyrhynchus TaxID=3082113 RepID=A0ACB0F4H6_RANTA|nr:unnamed protein product [Rangifer tarandus platyrhynchus]